MFYDVVQKRLSRPNEKMVKLVVEKRKKNYTRMVRNAETGQIDEVIIGTGFETVKEINTTEAGEKIWRALHPEEKTTPAEEATQG